VIRVIAWRESHGRIDSGVGCLHPLLEIFTQAPIIAEPGKGASTTQRRGCT
jgi:hypothetical protein